MKTRVCLILYMAYACLAGAASAPATGPASIPATINFPKIDRRPKSAANELFFMLRRLPMKQEAFPTFDLKSANPFEMDLRNHNLSMLDLREKLADLLRAHFDSRTIWPPPERMPPAFDSGTILELGKNPGLGVRKLHATGATGRRVGIAIIDQVLLTEHQEFADRLRLYEEINIKPGTPSQMHGPAVASIAVGKTLGVAPDADLYYIATWAGDFQGKDGLQFNFRYYAQAIQRVLQINRHLPQDRKIRVIAMAVGWTPDHQGHHQIAAACEQAKAAGILVLSSSVENVHGFKFNGLGRAPMADPDAFDSYEPGMFWTDLLPNDYLLKGRLMAPMDSRTTASPCGPDEYVFYRQAGWSWAIPYIAGVYALAAQADPAVTPNRFWDTAMKTGRTIQVKRNGQIIPLGSIIDAPALLRALANK